jgi:type II secretory pathway pseudopilin PulG
MTGGFNTSGFTIIETLIVLGITAVLLLSAMYTLSGKTGQGEFTQAINGIKTSLQQIINNSSAGIYPGQGTFTCGVTGTGTISINTPPYSNNCTFLGRMINFNNYVSGTPQTYTVYTIVGQQCYQGTQFSSGCTVPSSWLEAGPYILPASTKTQTTQTVFNGISLYSITLNGGAPLTGSAIPLTNIGFLANHATLGSASSPTANNISPGALQLNVFAYTSSPSTSLMKTAYLTQENEIDLCFASSTTDKSVEIILNGTGAQAIVSTKAYGGYIC